MNEKIENILAAYSDLYMAPDSGRIDELESKIAGIDFDGIYISTPESLANSNSGIPLLSLSGNTLLRSWEVNQQKNGVLVAIEVETGKARFWPLYPASEKKMRMMPKPSRPVGEAAEAREYGSLRRILSESTGGIPSGEYAISLLEWDRASNIRVSKIPTKANAAIPKIRAQDMPFERWVGNEADFHRQPHSPTFNGNTGLAARIVGSGAEAKILVSFGLKASEIHPVGTDVVHDGQLKDLRGVVPVQVLLLTLDNSEPELNRLLIPIFKSDSAHSGDVFNGWFTFPLDKATKPETIRIYVFVGRFRAGPLQIPHVEK